MKDTRSFSTLTLLSIVSGVQISDGDLRAAVEFLVGPRQWDDPVLPLRELVAQARAKILRQHPELDIDFSAREVHP